MLKLIRTKLERVQKLLKTATDTCLNSLKFDSNQTVSFEKHDRILKEKMNIVLGHQTDLMEIQTKSELHLEKLKELHNKYFEEKEKLLLKMDGVEVSDVNVKGVLYFTGQMTEIENILFGLKTLIDEFEL